VLCNQETNRVKHGLPLTHEKVVSVILATIALGLLLEYRTVPNKPIIPACHYTTKMLKFCSFVEV